MNAVLAFQSVLAVAQSCPYEYKNDSLLASTCCYLCYDALMLFQVAVVEASAMGGTCVNVGCVPKKVMLKNYLVVLCNRLCDPHIYQFEY